MTKRSSGSPRTQNRLLRLLKLLERANRSLLAKILFDVVIPILAKVLMVYPLALIATICTCIHKLIRIVFDLLAKKQRERKKDASPNAASGSEDAGSKPEDAEEAAPESDPPQEEEPAKYENTSTDSR